MGDVYAAISADQAVNLVPPDSPSPFLISNSPRREKQPKGYGSSSLQPRKSGEEREREWGRGRQAERRKGGGRRERGKTPSKTACFLLYNFQIRISSLINAN